MDSSISSEEQNEEVERAYLYGSITVINFGYAFQGSILCIGSHGIAEKVIMKTVSLNGSLVTLLGSWSGENM